ncbi:MAG: hypothetical protein ACXACU_11570 [Candidatus Hodarchaeales archaeon]|jgi:hypothetical protein
MSTKRKKGKEKGYPCVNHPKNYDTEECERCQRFFCAECYIEDWQENFLHQFIGQKRDFIQKIYCIPCQKRVGRVRMIAYLGLLAIFVTPFAIWLILQLFP